jgi:hypothetical protein
MKDYFRRELKFLIYILFIFFVVLVIVPLLGGQKPAYTINEISHDRRMLTFLILIFAYSLVYPVIAFTTIKRHLNGSYSDNREHFDKAFEALGFEKIIDTSDQIIFRKKSKVTRFLQWGEDKVIINPAINPITLSGLRKNIKRIDSLIDQYLMK